MIEADDIDARGAARQSRAARVIGAALVLILAAMLFLGAHALWRMP